ncbi:hypothetical protein LG204_00750 [Methylovorus menthalis]|uniref:hypothetical protein n=1 Tax=Methylovorus menthalis TaxID=1002227 RepID=UPI001E5603A1|nr:hypothetical protein [Methylovorus menthalis]MCB4809841.1 hypothetical protein [Methylovorus menthalis]
MVSDSDISGIRHQSLAQQGFWRLVWYGKLDQLGPYEGNAKIIKAYLQKLTDKGSSGLSRASVSGEYQIVDMPIGELARIPIGTVIKNGIPQSAPLPFFEKELKEKLNFAENNIEIIDRYTFDHEKKLIIPNKSGLEKSDYQANQFFLTVGEPDNKFRYIVPCTEIFRFFYATSSVMANAFLSGAFLNPNIDLWDAEASKLNDKKALIWLRKGMLDADAHFLARFVWNEFALKRAKEIFIKGAVYHKNERYSRMLYARPPIDGQVEFTFRSRSLGNGSLLITRLLKCNWIPSEYTELKWGRDNGHSRDRTEKININSETLKASTWPRAYPGRLDELEELVPDNPNSIFGNFQIEENEIAERFPELVKIQTSKIFKEKSLENQKREKPKRFVKKVVTASVLPRSTSKSTVGTAHIKGLIPHVTNTVETIETETQVSFRENLEVLHHLKRIKTLSLASVDYMLVTQPEKALIDEVDYNVLGGGNIINNWIFLDNPPRRIRRTVLIAKITNHNQRTRYVIEVQHKRAKESATIIIWDENQGEISSDALKFILNKMAQLKSTDVPLPSGLQEKRVKHTFQKNEHERFLAAVFN